MVMLRLWMIVLDAFDGALIVAGKDDSAFIDVVGLAKSVEEHEAAMDTCEFGPVSGVVC